MTIDDIILELYRLAETRKWRGNSTHEALAAAIEGMEHIKTQKMADRRKSAIQNANKNRPRVWC